jgi:alginate O-acetyltransferase complex protein AlgI
MLFNSITYAIFFPIVFFLYWFVLAKNLKYQNLLLLIASYIFYGWWDWKFLALIVLSTVADYYIAILISKTQNNTKKKFILCFSLTINLGILAFFKYYNFFISSLVSALSTFGIQANLHTLNIILPVGISFYTFQALSYTIDVYYGKIKASKSLINFATFVAFFPQLVAGPIERAGNLLPQFSIQRTFNYSKAVDGLRQILWGLFKKIVIADSCAEYANLIFDNSANFSGSTLLLGAIFFSIQIYSDFSGYSDIAIGSARLLGFNLMKNFATPYFSRNISEFWKRWHISLSTWFRDYLYIPLGGDRKGLFNKFRNIFIVFTISGLWHGANLTFILWGAIHGFYYLLHLVFSKSDDSSAIVAQGKLFPNLKEVLQMFFTFSIAVLSWIIFRASSLTHAIDFYVNMFSRDLFTMPKDFPLFSVLLILLFFIIEWLGREQDFALERLGLRWKKPLIYSLYYTLMLLIMWFSQKEQNFIYFQF